MDSALDCSFTGNLKERVFIDFSAALLRDAGLVIVRWAYSLDRNRQQSTAGFCHTATAFNLEIPPPYSIKIFIDDFLRKVLKPLICAGFGRKAARALCYHRQQTFAPVRGTKADNDTQWRLTQQTKEFLKEH